MEAAANALPPCFTSQREVVVESSAPDGVQAVTGCWMPTCRAPEVMFDFYRGKINAISEASRAACRTDLSTLEPPPNLSEAQFNLWMRSALMQKRFFAMVEALIEDGPRFGELKRRLSLQIDGHGDARDWSATLQAVMRWLVHFFPERFRIRVYRFSEHLEQAR